DSINNYGRIGIRIASPNDIRSWSYGEVKKPETINYRTYRPEKDGLFCERIFGPERDWECSCGKYKGIKYKDIICDRCGVKVTHSRVRRERMGHINLAVPVVHIWFFKSLPSRLGALLDLKTTALQQVVYYQRYIVTNPGDTPLKMGEILSEEQYRECREKYGHDFVADMGGSAVRELLKGLDLQILSEELKAELAECKLKLKSENLIKRLGIVNAMLKSQNDPAWMVMDVIPVIPPDLRPLVPLESGNFATSDLNDLYRRVIYRNNRLARLLDLSAPQVIVRNEKRMLQQAVDALFDNSRTKRPVLGAGNRPLKSLTDMLKGKQGRFRANLLGKRVDYSARSVIIVGPDLRLDQCGLPKKIALELYQPFIIRRLKDKGLADTIKSAKKMLERKDEEIWDVLEEVIHGHPVLLNRAPTLHRMGIQAFYPVLVEGDAIRLHPLVCSGFNADFDGDQMAVHLPLSIEAQTEATMLMLSTANIFSPAHGNPIITPDLDIVLGCYYLTMMRDQQKGEDMTFRNEEEAILAHDEGRIALGAKIKVRLNAEVVIDEGGEVEKPEGNGLYVTTVGRIFFNDILPAGMHYYNRTMKKKVLGGVVSDCHLQVGRDATVVLLDSLKNTGFHYATVSGLSFAASDLKTPSQKAKVIATAEEHVANIEEAHAMGDITDGERYNQIVDAWSHVTEEITNDLMDELGSDDRGPDYINPLWAMFDSGARASTQQIRQLAGFRGLMTKPNGDIIETPIRSNFREGLRGLEYFTSTHGTRKGLADTALQTANSGYLTRKLVQVAQDVVITASDCGTELGVSRGAVMSGEHVEVTMADNIFGRVALDNITDILTDEVIVRKGELINRDEAKRIENMDLGKIRVRSPLTCEMEHGICAKCYGMDLSTNQMVENGMAVGVIAAQSVGEPGTQLTMRTFHTGGIAKHSVRQSEVRADSSGKIVYHNIRTVATTIKDADGKDEKVNVVLNRNGEIAIVDDKNLELGERIEVPAGAVVLVTDGQEVSVRDVVASWDPYNTPILTDQAGFVRYEDIIEGETMRSEADAATGFMRKQVTEYKGDLHPQVLITDETGHILAYYSMPEKAFLEVEEGEKVEAGATLAKVARDIETTQDITGGLPRVTELFEARKPKEPAVMAEIDGVVELGDRRRGKRIILVTPENGGDAHEHLVPQGKHVRVHSGDRVRAGEALVDGPLVPHDILRIRGEEHMQNYLLNEVQNVYRAQNVRINDKHIECLVRQMLRKVEIKDSGDTTFLRTDQVDKCVFARMNRETMAKGGEPATGQPLLLGIARASLTAESFIAASSFQETTKVLTQAALSGKQDVLRGLKENVIIGHIIPAGTGFPIHRNGDVGLQAEALASATQEVNPEEELVAVNPEDLL
ncbi:MAG: DNA-directed RNA polymerase subunit beta', partial [Planctomycetota bacterium]